MDVPLSEGTSVRISRENPFFFKNGSYTLDIDINLEDKDAARVFSGLERFNHSWKRNSGRATLLHGGRVAIAGTGVILQKDDNLLKMQILSDNSELNYICDDSTRLRDLDLGSAQYTMSDVLEDADKYYPEVKFSFPQIEGFSHTILNRYGTVATGNFSYSPVLPNMSPQPYLLHIIDLVLDAMGYRVVENFLADDVRWGRLMMVNPYHTDDFAKMLPDWSVSEFFTEVERFFNCVILVDSVTNEARIVSFRTWYATAPTVYLDNRLDCFDLVNETGENTSGLSIDKAVAYRGTGTLFWKAAKLSRDFIATLGMTTDISDVDGYTFYHVADADINVKLYSVENKTELYRLGQFASYSQNGKTDEIERRIFPATIYYTGDFFVPQTDILGLAGTQQFWELVNDGVATDMTRDYLEVCFYMGRQFRCVGMGSVDSRRLAPQCLTSFAHPISSEYPAGYFPPGYALGYDRNLTLDLAVRGPRDFQNRIRIDEQHMYRVYFRAQSMPDVRSFFVIDGRKMICHKISKELLSSHQTYVYEGEFYPVLE